MQVFIEEITQICYTYNIMRMFSKSKNKNHRQNTERTGHEQKEKKKEKTISLDQVLF